MGNKEILEDINKKIKMCQEIINSKSKEEIGPIIQDLEKQIEQFHPENNIQDNIIKNFVFTLLLGFN